MRRPKTPKLSTQTIKFEIDHLDPMGQGVHKKGKNIIFVAGTLPGETGTAIVYKRHKGVQFARLEQLDKLSEDRIEAECPHFDQCPGCQYQHTSYESELAFKKAALARHLNALKIGDLIKVVPAPRRFGYRNRVQLHYRHKYIGMLDAVNDKVMEVPHCKIFRREMQPAFDDLNQKLNWTEDHSGHGHCELYLKDGNVETSWNKEYAFGGFSQVFEEMNDELQVRVQELLVNKKVSSLLDLFSGKGNLSNAYAEAGGQRVLVDSYLDLEQRPDNFQQLDLYDDEALTSFNHKKTPFDTLLIDPPRRGFPALDRWIKKLKPRNLIYVSCNPASLARDLNSITKSFKVDEVQLLDLFPATSHFETLVSLVFKKN